MSKRVQFKLSSSELEAVSKFSGDVGIPVDRLAKLALFWTMRRAYSNGEAGASDSAGTATSTSAATVSDSGDVLAEAGNLDGDAG